MKIKTIKTGMKARRLLTGAFITLFALGAWAALAGAPSVFRVAAQSEPQRTSAAGVEQNQSDEAKEINRRARLEQTLDLLLARTQKQETVRVIVQLRGDFKAARKWANEQDAVAQRARIADASAAFADRLRPLARGGMKTYSHMPFVALNLDAEGLEALRSAPEVESVSEDYVGTLSLDESVPLINAPTAWNAGYTGSGQVVAILDTGVERLNPFLQGKLVKEACFSTTNSANDSETVCPNGLEEQYGTGAADPPSFSIAGYDHGTHVAGIAAGKGSSFSGVAKDARIIAVQIFSKFTTESECGKDKPVPCLKYNSSDLLAGLNYVLSLANTYNIAAVNMSIGGGRYNSYCDSASPAIRDAFSQLISARIAPVVASGNDSDKDSIAFPACLSPAVSVGATDKNDVVAMFSNSAGILDLLAPGVNIYSSAISVGGSGSYGTKSGTSMATPHVTGAFALLRSKIPGASVDQLFTALRISGVPVTDAGNNLTKPRIDLAGALNATCSVTVSPGSFTFAEEGGVGQFNVTTPNGSCIWRAQSSVPWIKIISTSGVPSNGNIVGNGTVHFKVDPWGTIHQTQRLGAIKIGGTGKSASVKQISFGY